MPESKKRHLQESDLVYPQLSSLAPNEVATELEYLFMHRRNMMGIDAARAGFMGFNPMGGGHPIPPQMGFDQFGVGVGIGIPDGPGRFPQGPFQQPLPHQGGPGQMIQAYPGPGVPNPPRLTHHHSAPPGSLPNVQGQMMFEQEAALGARAGIPPGAHMVQYPPGIPVNLMRRSISPVLVQPVGGGNGGPMSGKSNGRNVSGPSGQVLKEHKRLGPSARPPESEIFEQEKDWELHADRYKTREKEVRGREVLNDSNSHFERERVRERERDRDLDREPEQDLDRPSHLPMAMQRHPSHQHSVGHLHPSSSQAAHHHGPHSHHHHHHHVHHHHHPNNTGPNQVPSGASTNVVALHPSNGILSRHSSPHSNREYERRAHSGAPVEVIDLSSKPAGPGPASLWKTNDEPPSSSLDAHEQGRRNIGFGAQERVPPPSFPSSPRGGTGGPPAHMSVPRSRRESWSTPDEGGQPRPSSSSSGHLSGPNVTGPSRISATGSTTPRPQVSPSIPTRPSPAMVSPSRQNSIRLPPLSPALAASARSPLRMPQTLPGPSLPPVPTSNPSSPENPRRAPSPLGRPKSPTSRSVHSQILAGSPSIPLPQKSAPASPGIYPTPLSHPSLPPNPRLPIIGTSSET